MTDSATTPEPRPVVAAIVTSERGVLAGRRNDGKPPRTFIAGEIEPGEAEADAAVREVKEETGLLVTANEREIGRRIHPKSGRTMIYLACTPPTEPACSSATKRRWWPVRPGHIGELTQIVAFEMVDAVLAETGKVQTRIRDLPARVVVYLVLAAGLFTEIGYQQVWARMTSGLDGLAPANPDRRRAGPSQIRCKPSARRNRRAVHLARGRVLRDYPQPRSSETPPA